MKKFSLYISIMLLFSMNLKSQDIYEFIIPGSSCSLEIEAPNNSKITKCPKTETVEIGTRYDYKTLVTGYPIIEHPTLNTATCLVGSRLPNPFEYEANNRRIQGSGPYRYLGWEPTEQGNGRDPSCNLNRSIPRVTIYFLNMTNGCIASQVVGGYQTYFRNSADFNALELITDLIDISINGGDTEEVEGNMIYIRTNLGTLIFNGFFPDGVEVKKNGNTINIDNVDLDRACAPLCEGRPQISRNCFRYRHPDGLPYGGADGDLGWSAHQCIDGHPMPYMEETAEGWDFVVLNLPYRNEVLRVPNYILKASDNNDLNDDLPQFQVGEIVLPPSSFPLPCPAGPIPPGVRAGWKDLPVVLNRINGNNSRCGVSRNPSGGYETYCLSGPCLPALPVVEPLIQEAINIKKIPILGGVVPIILGAAQCSPGPFDPGQSGNPPTSRIIESLKENDDLANMNDISVFPNPFENVFTLSYTSEKRGEIMIEVFDALGKQVFSTLKESYVGVQRVEIESQAWIPGVYIITVMLPDGSKQTRKLMKSR
ncbi:MAG: T9SS type A sorting domain-containing protein [Bacteroidota bacterium]